MGVSTSVVDASSLGGGALSADEDLESFVVGVSASVVDASSLGGGTLSADEGVESFVVGVSASVGNALSFGGGTLSGLSVLSDDDGATSATDDERIDGVLFGNDAKLGNCAN